MAGSAESLNFKIQNLDEHYKRLGLSDRELAARKTVNLRPLTLFDVYNWIDAMDLGPDIKAGLKKAASGYPNQALSRFVANYESILGVIIKTRRDSERNNSSKRDCHEKTTENKDPVL